MNSLSIVIPTLNEATALPALLRDLAAQRGIGAEVIVADGGSDDGTAQLAEQLGARLVRSARGRGRQMNAGAAAAGGELLLFLHADSALDTPTLLADAVAALQQANDPRAAGHFALRFARSQPGHEFFFRYLEGKTRLNRPGTINGDQGLLLSRRFFEELGGYDTCLPFLEDQDIAARIEAVGRWRLLPGTLQTSARRFEQEGHARRYALMALLMAMRAAAVEEFFRLASGIYAPQDEAERLLVGPYRRLARDLLRGMEPQQRRAVLRRIGRLLGDNAWQLAYALDPQGGNDGRWLQRYDRHVAPRLAGAPAEILGAMAAAVALWMPLPRGC